MIALTALAEQLFDIAERKRVPKVPAHGAKNQFGLRACRHLKIAARTAFFMISSGYQPHRPKLQHNRERCFCTESEVWATGWRRAKR